MLNPVGLVRDVQYMEVFTEDEYLDKMFTIEEVLKWESKRVRVKKRQDRTGYQSVLEMHQTPY